MAGSSAGGGPVVQLSASFLQCCFIPVHGAVFKWRVNTTVGKVTHRDRLAEESVYLFLVFM